MTKPTTDRAEVSPTKQFFVSMLTRDINLADAILDLLDNCLDGALRRAKAVPASKGAHALVDAPATTSKTEAAAPAKKASTRRTGK